MKFVEQMMAGMIWIDQFREFFAKNFDLLIVQQTNAGEVTVRMKELDLILGETVLIPIVDTGWLLEKLGDWFVVYCQVNHSSARRVMKSVPPASAGGSKELTLEIRPTC
jgi:hypothetical protein